MTDANRQKNPAPSGQAPNCPLCDKPLAAELAGGLPVCPECDSAIRSRCYRLKKRGRPWPSLRFWKRKRQAPPQAAA